MTTYAKEYGLRTDAERKQARFWHRFFVGAEIARELRFLTLNSSDESVVLGIDILDSFRKLVKRIRRKYEMFEYFAVVGEASDEPLRKHIHAICKGVYLPQRELENMWIDVHKSIKPYIKKIKSVKGAANYLAKYMHKQSSNRYIMSAGWVFKGWISWSKWYKQNYGVYPQQIMADAFRMLANMSQAERNSIIMPELMALDKKRKGKQSRALERKRPFTAGVGVN